MVVVLSVDGFPNGNVLTWFNLPRRRSCGERRDEALRPHTLDRHVICYAVLSVSFKHNQNR